MPLTLPIHNLVQTSLKHLPRTRRPIRFSFEPFLLPSQPLLPLLLPFLLPPLNLETLLLPKPLLPTITPFEGVELEREIPGGGCEGAELAGRGRADCWGEGGSSVELSGGGVGRGGESGFEFRFGRSKGREIGEGNGGWRSEVGESVGVESRGERGVGWLVGPRIPFLVVVVVVSLSRSARSLLFPEGRA